MTTDEATKKEGEVQAATLAEQGEDITPNKDRGVLKVRVQEKLMFFPKHNSLETFQLKWQHPFPSLSVVKFNISKKKMG